MPLSFYAAFSYGVDFYSACTKSLLSQWQAQAYLSNTRENAYA